MKTLILVLLCAVIVNARWSIHYGSKQAKQADGHDHDHELDWWEHGVFYQIYPRSFKDSDGDGIGDIQGIIDKLDHLKDLGVTGAWLSPIFKSPMKDGGYDIQDFYQVDPMFGDNNDLARLFTKAKDIGIKIILDFVPNHTSDQHNWFLLSANRTAGYEDYYVWRDCDEFDDAGKRILPNNWIAVFHTPAWTYHVGRGQCYLHQFTPEQPDLNYRNEAVYNAMIEILRHWLVQGADGFRIDAINHMFEVEGLLDESYIDLNGDLSSYDNLYHNHTMNLEESYNFIFEVRKMMDVFVEGTTDKVTKLMMTEAYATIPNQVRWYGYNDTTRGAHMPFNFALISDLNVTSGANEFKDAADSWLDAMPEWGVANWVLGNHDRPRLGYRYGEDRHESLAIMSMMMPGMNVIYYGEEILMTNNMNISFEESDDPQARQTNSSVYMLYTRDPVRTPFQWDDTDFAGFTDNINKTWLPVHENYREVNLKNQKAAEKSTFKLYQKLIELRKENHVLQQGGYHSMVLGDRLFGFTRNMTDHPSIAVLINLGGETKTSLKTLMGETYVDGLKAQILIVNNNSTLVIGEWIEDLEDISVAEYEAIVLEVSSATKLAISFLLIVCSLFKFVF